MTTRNSFIPKNAYCDFADFAAAENGVRSSCYPGR